MWCGAHSIINQHLISQGLGVVIQRATKVKSYSKRTILMMPYGISGPKTIAISMPHDDVIKWKYFPRYWPFVRGIHRSPVNSPHEGQWRGALFVFFDLRPKKRLSKQWWGWWFETPSRTLWRHCNGCSWNWNHSVNCIWEFCKGTLLCLEIYIKHIYISGK